MVTTGNFAGDYEPQGAIVLQVSKGTSAAIVKGNLLTVTTGKWNKAATTDTTGPFCVATKAAAATDTTCQAIFQGIVMMKAEGNITVNALVQPSTTTAGAVMAYAASSINSTTPTGTQTIAGASDFKRVVGIYLGHDNENDGSTIPTDAVDTDDIRVLLTAGGV